MRIFWIIVLTCFMPLHAMAQAQNIQCILPSAFTLSKNADIISLLNKENEIVKTPQFIDKVESNWHDYSKDSQLSKILARPASQYLKKYVEENPYYNEIFVTDFQGALAAASNETTDYFQGDETPYLYVRQYGASSFFVGHVEGDVSSQSFGQKIALPILDNEITIGVLVLVVNSWYNEYFDACKAPKNTD